MILSAGRVGAQESRGGSFNWQASLDTIPKEGFYQILLTPEIVAKCSKDNLADLRLITADNRFVSYVSKDSRGIPDTSKGWLSIPAPRLAQKDSNNSHSYLDVRFPDVYEIDRLAFTIRDPVFYKREATLFAGGVNENEWVLVTSITLAPRGSLFLIPSVKTRRLRIVIANADNAPLVVNKIAGYQQARWLIAYLKAGMGYRIVTGNAQAVAPQYDLKYFTDSLTTALPTLVPGVLRQAAVANDQSVPPSAKTTSGAHSGGLLLWSILLVILILLVYFSVRMVRSITKKEGDDRI
jgi:hypothetical protein